MPEKDNSNEMNLPQHEIESVQSGLRDFQISVYAPLMLFMLGSILPEIGSQAHNFSIAGSLAFGALVSISFTMLTYSVPNGRECVRISRKYEDHIIEGLFSSKFDHFCFKLLVALYS